MEVYIDEELLMEMLCFAKDMHPKEAILLLRGEMKKATITVTDYLFPPFATTNSISASYPIYMLPIDFSIIGTAHSHPSGTLSLSIQDINHVYGRISLLMVYPYAKENVAVFNKQGERVELNITASHPR